MLVCVIVFIVSAGMLGKYYYTGYEVQKEFKELAQYNLEDLYSQNEHTFGWLEIADTKISYPVMFTPESPEYYLRRNFEKVYSAAGTPFLDGHTNLEESKNMVIYGHHMKDGTMFNNLLKYDDENYAQAHSIIQFDTLKYGKKTYKVFAYGKTDALQKGFNVYNYINVTDKMQYDEFIRGLKGMTPHETGITPEYGQNLIMLSTCSYHTEEGRYIVVGVEVNQ